MLWGVAIELLPRLTAELPDRLAGEFCFMPVTATEKSITKSIQAWLKTQPDVWQFKVHGGPFQTAGIPDIVGVWAGRFFALEVKARRGVATVLQIKTLEKIEAAGGLASIVRSLDEVKSLFRAASIESKMPTTLLERSKAGEF